MFINITIYAKNRESIVNFLKKLYRLSNRNKIKLYSSLVKKKKRQKLFSLLKSPHVNKTAQNQFKLIVYKRNLILYTPKIFKFFLLLKKINELLIGIRLKIKFFMNIEKFYSNLVSNVNVDKFYLSKFKFSKNKIKKYVSMIDQYGELHFNLI